MRGVHSIYGDDFTEVVPGVQPIRLGLGGLTMADTNGDGTQDPIAGTPEATVDGKTNAGMVVMLLGNNDGFFPSESQVTTQTARVSPATPRPATRSARRWPRVTSPRTASATW